MKPWSTLRRNRYGRVWVRAVGRSLGDRRKRRSPNEICCLPVDRHGVTLIGVADANCSVPDMVAVPVAAAGQTGPVPVRV